MESGISRLENRLINYYRDALNNLIAMYQSQHIAENYEQSVTNSLNSIKTNNGVYVTPSDISVEQGERLVRDSVNAQLSKVQSSQISQKTLFTVAEIESDAKSEFIGKKINISRINPKSDCIDAVLFDNKTGEYRVSKYSGHKIKGTIEDISLENNLLVIKPTAAARFITPNRILFHIYVFNLESLSPEIRLDF